MPVSYLLGAIPWGYIIPRLSRGIDIRKYGSGNIGMANVLRTVGGWLAGVVLALDVGKGVLAVLLAWLLTVHSPRAQVVAGIMALIGHDWSVFLRFRGGRGAAVALGGLLVMAPYAAIAGVATFVAIMLKSRYVSLGSITGAAVGLAAFPVFAAFRVPNWLGVHSWTYICFAVAAACIVVLQHRDNIRRLLRGEERKLGEAALISARTEARERHE